MSALIHQKVNIDSNDEFFSGDDFFAAPNFLNRFSVNVDKTMLIEMNMNEM